MGWEEKETAEWASKNHMYLGIASITNTVLIFVWSFTVVKELMDSVSWAKKNRVATLPGNQEKPGISNIFNMFSSKISI